MSCNSVVRQETSTSASSVSSRPSALIAMHGSFNPPHLGHVRMMIRAREFLQARGYDVDGEFATTSASWIQGKHRHAMKTAVRIGLLERMIQSEGADSWLKAFDGSGVHSTFGWLEMSLRGKSALPVHVGGVDVMENYNEIPPVGGLQIVIGREGHPPWEPHSSKVTYLPADPGFGAASSTGVNAAMQAGQWDVVAGMCGAEVAGMLRALGPSDYEGFTK
ncbi:hypothetical protein T484DRAFT_1831697 [Baffinella frigidus]|nr:hypothetical protein T484DRAFT_1831697 [Cryptophyta sp. CCMP2293]